MTRPRLGRLAGALARLFEPPLMPLYDFAYLDRLAPERLAAVAPQPLADLDVVVLDTETTGLSPRAGDRVVALAAVRVRQGRVLRDESFDTLVRPGRAIPASATRIHGITDAMVAGAPGPDEVLPAFLEFASGSVLAAHDAWFDLAFLEPDLARLGRPPLASHHPVLDPRLLATVVHGPAPTDLDTLARRLGLTIAGRHSALGDALGAADVLVRLFAALRDRGVETLGHALAASRGLRPRVKRRGR